MADGEDVAMVRATLVDADGNPAVHETHKIQFTVVAGEGRLISTQSGA